MASGVSQKKSAVDHDHQSVKYSKNRDQYTYLGERWLSQDPPDSPRKYNYVACLVTAIAFVLRFRLLYYPAQVVFDEVHFGKFASYYLERTYFFDVHPPFAKMLIAFVGWVMNYDGAFKFEDIGHSYEDTQVPYVVYRSLSAVLGTLTIPVMFYTMKELNFNVITCFLASILVAVDNAHVIDSRLILLDATLIFAVAISVYSYVRFYKEQLKKPFTSRWYFWLYSTGLSLSFVISTKYVGVFTYAMIGTAVAVNLWQLLDIRAGLSLRICLRHFVQRINGLIMFPFLVYLFWFYVHFSVLSKSGPGDDFMSAQFQETLEDSPIAAHAREVHYYDIVKFKHPGTQAFLHSHEHHYPLRYEDGRISSQGQQVTGYSHEDANNNWEIIPTKELENGENEPVLLDDVIRLRHVMTNTYLLAHDVASPLYPTNEEITTTGEDQNYEQTLFKLQPFSKKDAGKIVKSKATSFRIFHVDTVVALWTHNDELLPEWAYKQQEVNGNKDIKNPANSWNIDSIVNISEERNAYVPKEIKKLGFFTRWLELQRLMFEYNNKLSADHPFASQPGSWPLAQSGVSFWTNNEERKQIFFSGNIMGWFFQIISLSLYVGVLIADLLTRQRACFVFGKISREKLYGPLMFLFIGWCFHYFPFFLMSRQKFLHHYLPAHLIAALFTAAFWEVVFSKSMSVNILKDESDPTTSYVTTPRVYRIPLTVFTIIVSAALFSFFFYFSALVYGDRSLTPEQLIAREWMDIKLHFTK